MAELIANPAGLGCALCLGLGATVGRVVLGIIGEVAPLAGGEKLVILALLGSVIAVGGGEDHLGGGYRVRLPVPGGAAAAVIVAAFPLAFAPPLRAHEPDAVGYLHPIGRVARAVFRGDWHLDAKEFAGVGLIHGRLQR